MTGSSPATERLSAADAHARELAQTRFEQPLVLEAGAGTGKTTVAVARIVAWSVGPGWERAQHALGSGAPSHRVATRVLQRLVAITFTEAAAAEMEQRAAQALAELAGGVLPRGVLAHALPEPELCARRARALLGVLDRLFVRTIHGYCRRLLATHPLEAGLHPAFVVDARGLTRGEVVREVLEEHLRQELAGQDRPALLELAQRGVPPNRVERALSELLEAGVAPRDFAADPLAPARLRSLAARLDAALEGLAQAARALGGLRSGAKAHAVLDAVSSLRQALSRAEVGTPARAAALAARARSAWPDDVRGRLRDWARARLNASERRSLGAGAAQLVARAAALLPLVEGVCDLDPERLAAGHRALHPLLERAEAELRRRGAEGYAALLRDAHALLAGRPEVAARERSRTDQLLVDEFQDTDPLQYAIVAALALEGPERERPGLFLVGDPKQSIYGWRNADLRAYADFLARVRAAGGERHELCRNHRSLPAILREVERVVGPTMVPREGVQPPFQRLLPACAAPGDPAPPAVEYWLVTELGPDGELVRTPSARASALEARALARDLRRAESAGELAWRDVGILLRGTGDLDVYLDALRGAGIPYVVDRDRSYFRRREVLEAATLVRTLLDPNDQIALVATLRSAWVGVPDAAWRPLWEREFPDAVRAALLGDAAARARAAQLGVEVAAGLDPRALPGLSRVAGWERNLAHALEVLVALRGSFACDPSDRFVERLRRLPLLEATESARHPGAYRVANLERFFRELLATLEDAPGDVSALLRTLRAGAGEEGQDDAGRPRNAVENAVQVLTIHKAKGLDFEHVYLMQTHKRRGENEERQAIVERVGDALACRLFGAPSPDWDAVATRRREVERAETVRTLYVAMTRARRRLVVSGLWPRTPSSQAERHADLLAHGLGPVAERALARADPAQDRVEVDDGDVRWVFPGLGRAEVGPPWRARTPRLAPRARVAEESKRLGEARRRAEQHARRPFAAAASGASPAELRERLAARLDHEPLAPREREDAAGRAVALAVGTAIHALLERVGQDPARHADPTVERAQLEADVARLLPEEQREAARVRAGALLEALRSGPLLERLRALAPHVLARELPVLLPPQDGEGPVGYVAGALDLLYRDPLDGQLVVADFKTDRVSGAQDEAQLGERYASQGGAYVRAVRDALCLDTPPRFELWLIESGRILEVPASG